MNRFRNLFIWLYQNHTMTIPIYSTVALFTECIMLIVILYIFYNGYKYNRFNYKLVAIALSYEIIFNISYMLYRTVSAPESKSVHSAIVIGFAILHGILSLVMFILLIVFLLLAWKNYKKKINYFKKHSVLSLIFIIFWLIAVISGIIIYAVYYL